MLDASIPHQKWITVDHYERAPKRYRWKQDTDPLKFKESLTSTSCTSTLEKIMSKQCNNKADVDEINSLLVKTMQDAADILSLSQKLQSKASRKLNAKEPWYDEELSTLKRKINRHSRWLCKYPQNSTLRESLFRTRKEYKTLTRKKKSTFIEVIINKKVEDDRHISWECFKDLKAINKNDQELDIFDMVNFVQFFKELYSSSQLGPETIATFETNNNLLADTENMLNRDIDMEELRTCIRKLKSGKAAAEDRIINEFAKNSNDNVLTAYLKVFNECLKHGHYPWNTAIVTPIHKKGNLYDPNNYRAIAVGSCIGKLFSSILLDCMVRFRTENSPNPPNRLGFCAEARTADHIFTLDTCIQKYVKKQKKGTLIG